MFDSKGQKGGWCGCCDGKDSACRCMHHKFVWIFIKALILLVALIFVFAAGVAVGKFSAFWHGSYYGQWENPMMQYRANPYPMMRQYYPGQNGVQNPIATPFPQQ